jgi:hypothetical protein
LPIAQYDGRDDSNPPIVLIFTACAWTLEREPSKTSTNNENPNHLITTALSLNEKNVDYIIG